MNPNLTKAPRYPKLVAILVIVIVLAGVVVAFKYQERVDTTIDTDNPASTTTPLTGKPSFTDPRNGKYVIDGEQIVLVDGTATETIPDSVSTIVTSVFGEPVEGDLDGDGDLDAVLFLVQETSGTGIPFYVTVAVNVSNGNINTGYIGTNAIFIGDRIAPQNIVIVNGVAQANFATRRDSDPMIEPPTIGATKYFNMKNGQLIEVNASE